MVKELLIDWNEYPCGANGQMYSHLTKKYLNGTVNNYGYVQVMLKCTDGKRRMFMWHRVIYTYFYGTIPEGMQINHINEDKTDNRLCNLELVTPSQNINHATRNERVAEKLKGISKSEEHKRKLSESHKGIKQSKEVKAKISSTLTNGITSKPVVAVDEDGNVVCEFASTMEAGRNGFCQSAVAACCRGCYTKQNINYYKGYYWYFKEDYLRMIKGVA